MISLMVALIPLFLATRPLTSGFDAWRRRIALTTMLCLIYLMFGLWDATKGDIFGGVEIILASAGLFKVTRQVRGISWINA